MNFLEKYILQSGTVRPGNILKIDHFLNHQLDVALLRKIGKEFHRRFADEKIDKILTIESSGIAIACITAQFFRVPVLFAKKSATLNIGNDFYRTEIFSYTRDCACSAIVSKEFLHPAERILILDDFLARGSAVRGMLDLLRQAGSIPVGIGIVVEKGFQTGGAALRRDGYRLESLAVVESMDEKTGKIVFRR